MDPYERMEQLVEELISKSPAEAQPLLEATRQSIFHPTSSLVTLSLFLVRDKPTLGDRSTLALIYIVKALEAARYQNQIQLQQFLAAAEKTLRSG